MAAIQRKRNLVTGATGFIGRRLVEQLLAKNEGVRILTRGNKALPLEWASEVECYTGDLNEADRLLEIAAGVDTVYHLAGEVRDPERFDAVNRVGTQSLLAICRASHVRRLVYLSSVGVVGATGLEDRVDEASVVRPRNGYEVSKYQGESLVLSANDVAGLQTVALRPSIVYGEGQQSDRDGFLRLARAIQSGRVVLCGEHYVSSYVYLGDVVAACLALAIHPLSSGQVYIVNEPIRLTSFVYEIAALLQVRKPPVAPALLGLGLARALRFTGRFASLYNQTVYSAEKLGDLGFAFPWGYRSGLRRTIAWYQGSGLLAPHTPALSQE